VLHGHSAGVRACRLQPDVLNGALTY
jgi:hypothetical protein